MAARKDVGAGRRGVRLWPTTMIGWFGFILMALALFGFLAVVLGRAPSILPGPMILNVGGIALAAIAVFRAKDIAVANIVLMALCVTVFVALLPALLIF